MLPECNPSKIRVRFLELLAKRRNYQQEVKDLVRQYEYVVFYGCGLVFHRMVDTWKAYVGREIDYCCDSDSSKWGKFFCGAKCLSPQELTAIKERCAVFVTVGDFEPVFEFLTESGFPSVHPIYKYDLMTSECFASLSPQEVADKLCQVYSILSDEQSRKVFDAVVERVLGDGKNVQVMADIYEKHQYFPEGIIKLSEHERFVDVGAFDGDTVRDLAARTQGKFDKVFSFELDAINFKVLQENVKLMSERDRIKCFNQGAWESECDITYSAGKSQSAVGEGESHGHVIPLDKALKDEIVTFIKMDIEGAEPQALRGAQGIIQAQKPKLAICIYHDFKHLWEIPLFVKKLVPEYKIYLRHHTKFEYETVCYAVL